MVMVAEVVETAELVKMILPPAIVIQNSRQVQNHILPCPYLLFSLTYLQVLNDIKYTKINNCISISLPKYIRPKIRSSYCNILEQAFNLST